MKKRAVGIIPARYKSSRYPGKPLVKLLGKPMIIWVAELTAKALGKENVYVATEDIRIFNVVEDYGFNCKMTPDHLLTGTDRVAYAAKSINADIYLNIQGDEPTIDPNIIIKVLNYKIQYPNFIINSMTKLNKNEDPNNINIPKVIVNKDNDMVYMSRMAIPGHKNLNNLPKFYLKQVCIYAFSKNELERFAMVSEKGSLESFEDIEILRFLDLRLPVKMIEVDGDIYAVDRPEDVIVVESVLKNKKIC
mgnify:FL=1